MSDNAEVVTQAYDAFSRGDIPALLEMMRDDVSWEVTVADGRIVHFRESAAPDAVLR